MEGPCGGQYHDMMFHTLCELPTLVHNDNQLFIPEPTLHKSTIIEDKNSVDRAILHSLGIKALKPIGGVGSKLFFVNESPVIF